MEAPVFNESKKRMRAAEPVGRFFDSVHKREKIDEDLVLQSESDDMPVNSLSLRQLKANIEGMTREQLSSLLDDVVYTHAETDLDTDDLDFSEEINEESSINPLLEGGHFSMYQIVPQLQNSLTDSFLTPTLPRLQEATLSSLNSRALPSPLPFPTTPSVPYFGLSTSPSSFVRPSQVSPADFLVESPGQKKTLKDPAMSLFSSVFLPSAFSTSYLTQPGPAPAVRNPSGTSLLARHSDDKKKENHDLKVTTLLQAMDIDRDETSNTGDMVPPKPSDLTQHNGGHSVKKPVTTASPPSASVQNAMRFTKQDFMGFVEKVLKRV